MKIRFIIPCTALLLIAIFVFSSICHQTHNDSRSSWDQYLSKHYKKASAAAENLDLAALQNYYMTIDPALKRVPGKRLYKSFLKTKEMLLQRKSNNANNDLEWIEVGSNMGGRTRAIMFDPNDQDITKVWAGSATGGLWYNNNIYDNESEWQTVSDFWPGLSVSSIVSDPNNPMVFYAGTGEYQSARVIYRESSGVGFGIWKSMDGGLSWEIIPSTEEFKYISDLKIREEFGESILYAGVVSGFYHGINHQSEPSEGLYRSSDGGSTWEQVLPNIIGKDLPYAPADLEIAAEGRIFVGSMKNLDGDGGAAILYSDYGTPGTWTIFNEYEAIIQNDPDLYVPGRVILACAPSDANRVYALVGAGWLNSTNFNYAHGKYILKSDDGGQSWTEKNLPGSNPIWANLSWHAFTAGVDPSNPNKLFVGGKNNWKSNNAGNSWSVVSDWTLMYSGGDDYYVHCDQHVQLYTENSSDEMFLSTDGGIFYTDNASSSNPIFQEKNRNYNTLQYYTCSIYPLMGQNIFVGGLQDNGTLLYMGEPLDLDDMIDTGDGAYCFFDETEPEIMITSTYFNVYKLFYNWEHYDDMGIDGTGVFINPADYDSQNNILYANAVKFNNSYPNQILRIKGIPDDPQNQLIYLPVNLNSYFSNVKVSPHSPQGTSTLFLGSQNGRLFRVNNAQSNPSVTEIGSNEFPTAYISSIALGSSEDTLMVTFSNYGVPSVWQTYNGGSSWQNISGNLPDMPIRWSLYHPQNNNMVMLATELGIWSTSNANQVDVLWEPDAGMPKVRVDMLKLRASDNTVLAATHGRGLMYTSWIYDPYTSIDESMPVKANIYPNPASDFVMINLSSTIQSILVYDNTGTKVLEEQVNNSSIKLNTSQLASGIYIVEILTEDGVINKKVIVQ